MCSVKFLHTDRRRVGITVSMRITHTAVKTPARTLVPLYFCFPSCLVACGVGRHSLVRVLLILILTFNIILGIYSPYVFAAYLSVCRYLSIPGI